MITALVPSRTDAYLLRLLLSMETHQPGSTAAVVVIDNGLEARRILETRFPAVRYVAYGPEPFIFAKAINRGARTVSEGDLLLLNDDTIMHTPQWLNVLQAGMDTCGSLFAIVSCLLRGGVGNGDQVEQVWKLRGDLAEDGPLLVETTNTICFVAAVIRRLAWEALGELDERFTGYGFEDADYTRRALEAKRCIGTLRAPLVEHLGDGGGRGMHGTFGRIYKDAELSKMFQHNYTLFQQKWNP